MFFGWYIVAAALILAVYHGGTIGYGFTAFIDPIAAVFGWGYAQISLGLSFRGLEVGALDPFVGMAVDHWPPRRLVLIGVIIYGLGLVVISQATSLIVFYAGFLILGLGNSLSIHVVPQTIIARWFKKDLGKASAVLSLGGSVGGVLVPVLVKMIDAYSWQTSMLILAIGIWLIGIPLSFVFGASPEAHGLSLQAGKLPNPGKKRSTLATYDNSFTVKETLKQRAFWQIGIAYLLQMGAIHAVLTHVMPYLDSLGVARSTASFVAMSIPLLSIFARMLFGWLADIYQKKYVMALSFGLTSASLLLFWLMDGSSMLLTGAFVVIFGLGLSGPGPIRTPLIREYFGTRHFGTIYGLVSVFNMISLLVYPPAAGWVFDAFGSYKPIWLIFGLGSILAVYLMAAAPSSQLKSRLTAAEQPG